MADLPIQNFPTEVTEYGDGDYIPMSSSERTAKIKAKNLAKKSLAEIKNLSTAITDFRQGDNIAVDGPDGAAKMTAEKLLELTAQNALANNIASAFDPTVQCVAGHLYVFRGALVRCKTTYTGPYDPSKFFVGSGIKDTGFAVLGTNELPADLNDCATNVSYVCTNSEVGAAVANKPDGSNQFMVFTIPSASGSVKMQYYFGNGNSSVIYARSCWAGTWSAWNTLSAIVFARFSPYSTYQKGERVQNGNYSYVAKNYVSAGEWNASDWEYISNRLKPFIAGSPSDMPDDLNNCYINSAYTCTNATIGANTAHRPTTDDQFTVVTFGATNPGCLIQLFAPKSSSLLYMRNSWGGTWTSWYLINKNIVPSFFPSSTYAKGKVVMYKGNPYKCKQFITTAEEWDATKWEPIINHMTIPVCGIQTDMPSADLNALMPNTSYTCTSNDYGETVANRPTENKQFTVVTLGGANGGCGLQIFTPSNSNQVWVRNFWGGTWAAWTNITAEPKNTQNILAAFDNVVCIGDSLTYSQVYTAASQSRQAKRPYPKVLAKLCNFDSYEIFAIAGDDATENWERYKNSVTAKSNGLAIVYLGTNGGLTDTLDTDAPANTDPSTWASTNTGSYAKWVDKLKTLGYKILLIKPWAGGGSDLTTTKLVIDKVGTRFGCAVLEDFHTTEAKYHYYPDLSGSNSLHYNDLGYAWFTSELIRHVSELASSQAKYLIPN